MFDPHKPAFVLCLKVSGNKHPYWYLHGDGVCLRRRAFWLHLQKWKGNTLFSPLIICSLGYWHPKVSLVFIDLDNRSFFHYWLWISKNPTFRRAFGVSHHWHPWISIQWHNNPSLSTTYSALMCWLIVSSPDHYFCTNSWMRKRAVGCSSRLFQL